MVRRYGEIHVEIGIVALGRLGARQLTAGSDIDLLIIFRKSIFYNAMRVAYLSNNVRSIRLHLIKYLLH